MVLAGSAAGIRAAFNTPLAGIVFAIEEMSRTYESRANGLVLTAVILSGLVALGLSGSYNYFGMASAAPTELRDWGLVLICGVGGGALGAAFSGFALHFGQKIRRWALPQPLKRMLALAGVCGLAIAIIGVASAGATFGTGYEQARGAVCFRLTRAALESVPVTASMFKSTDHDVVAVRTGGNQLVGQKLPCTDKIRRH